MANGYFQSIFLKKIDFFIKKLNKVDFAKLVSKNLQFWKNAWLPKVLGLMGT